MNPTPRARKALHTLGIRELVLNNTVVEYPMAMGRCCLIEPHYSPPEHPDVLFTASALGLAAPYPLIIEAPQTVPSLYKNMAWVRKSGLSVERITDHLWTNGHMVVSGPLPGDGLSQRRLTEFTPPADAAPVDPPDPVALRVSPDLLCYRIGGLLVQTRYVDFLLSNIRTGCAVSYQTTLMMVFIYADEKFVGAVMKVNDEGRGAELEPHKPPKQNAKGVLPWI